MHARESQLTGRLRLRHLAEVHEAVEWEMVDERERFAGLVKDTAKTVVVSAFNLFQTPEDIAAQMVKLLGRTGRTLEPSAGLGRLYRAVRSVDASNHITLVDESSECCGQLYRETENDRATRLIHGDFLTQTVEDLGEMDCVIMNPPFKMWRDIKHILHAKSFLAPGGRLVALCANGPRQQATLKPIADEWIELPPGSFGKEGTNVNVAMMAIDN